MSFMLARRLIGEIRPQPSLRLRDLDCLPARVVLHLIPPDRPTEK